MIPPLDSGGGGLERRRQGRGRRPALAGATATLRGLAAVRARGNTERRPMGFPSPTHLKQEQPIEAHPRWTAEASRATCGGDARGLRESCVVVEAVA